MIGQLWSYITNGRLEGCPVYGTCRSHCRPSFRSLQANTNRSCLYPDVKHDLHLSPAALGSSPIQERSRRDTGLLYITVNGHKFHYPKACSAFSGVVSIGVSPGSQGWSTMLSSVPSYPTWVASRSLNMLRGTAIEGYLFAGSGRTVEDRKSA